MLNIIRNTINRGVTKIKISALKWNTISKFWNNTNSTWN